MARRLQSVRVEKRQIQVPAGSSIGAVACTTDDLSCCAGSPAGSGGTPGGTSLTARQRIVGWRVQKQIIYMPSVAAPSCVDDPFDCCGGVQQLDQCGNPIAGTIKGPLVQGATVEKRALTLPAGATVGDPVCVDSPSSCCGVPTGGGSCCADAPNNLFVHVTGFGSASFLTSIIPVAFSGMDSTFGLIQQWNVPATSTVSVPGVPNLSAQITCAPVIPGYFGPVGYYVKIGTPNGFDGLDPVNFFGLGLADPVIATYVENVVCDPFHFYAIQNRDATLYGSYRGGLVIVRVSAKGEPFGGNTCCDCNGSPLADTLYFTGSGGATATVHKTRIGHWEGVWDVGFWFGPVTLDCVGGGSTTEQLFVMSSATSISGPPYAVEFYACDAFANCNPLAITFSGPLHKDYAPDGHFYTIFGGQFGSQVITVTP